MLIDILRFFGLNENQNKNTKETKELKQAYRRKTKKLK
jgi:hypothetical protein|tara:strand:- start:169 stop:282 length:114 start_codon:yes stop_codon:yes gene_type:complete